jgi:hypothetical protein
LASIFLAHSSKDKQFARRLAKDIRNHDVRVWLDEAEMLIGDSLIQRIEQGIREMEYLGIILSPNSIQSEWVRRELEIALNDEIQGKRIKVLPILYRKCQIPAFLKGRVWADFSNARLYSRSFDLLIRRLSQVQYHTFRPIREWTPKAIRLGLSCGLLISNAGKIEFSQRLIESLSERGRNWAMTNNDLIEGWREFVVIATAEATFTGKKKIVPLYQEEVDYLFPEMSLHVANHLIGVGIKARIFISDSATISLCQDLVDEVFEVISIRAEEISGKKNVQPFLAQTFVDVVRARLLLYNSENSGLCHAIGMLALNFFDHTGYISEMKDFFTD